MSINKILNYSILCALCICSLEAIAQPSKLNFKHITTDDDLSQSVINTIFKDTHGFIWLATYDGINRYDGISIKSNDAIAEGLGSISVCRGVVEDDLGNIWIGSEEALIKFSYVENKFFTYKIGHDDNINVRDKIERYNPIKVKNGLVLFYSDERPCYYIFNETSKVFQKQFEFTGYENFNFDASVNGNLRSFIHDIYFLTSNENQTYLITLETDKSNKIRWCRNIILNKELQTLMGIKKLDKYIYIIEYPNEKNLKFQNHIKSKIYFINSENSNLSFFLDLNYHATEVLFYKNKIYITSSDSGIHILDFKTLKEEKILISNSLDPTTLSTQQCEIFNIFDDILWVAAWGKGLDYANLQQHLFSYHLSNYEANKNNTSNFIRGIVEDKSGDFYCNTLDKGIIKLDNQLNYLQTLKGTNDIASACIHIDKNDNLYFGNTGLVKYDVAKNILSKINFDRLSNCSPCNENHYIFDSHGELITASMNGIYKLDNLKNELFNIDIKNVELNESQQFIFIDGLDRLYAYHHNKGLIIYTKNKNNYIKHYQFNENFIPRHAYQQNDSTLWLGTTIGLINFNFKRLKVEKIYTTKHGLPNNTVYAIIPDTFNRLWLSTNNGISSFDLLSKTFLNYTDQFTFKNKEYNRHASCLASDGRMIFGGIDGITVVYPWIKTVNTNNPYIQFIDVKADKPLNPFANTTYENPQVLSAGNSAIEFSFLAIDFISPKECLIKYMLVGMDKSWQTSKNPSIARYVNLPPGKYVFKILSGYDRYGVMNSSKDYYFVIENFWWQSVIFKLFVGLVLIFIVYYIITQKIKDKLIAERMKLLKENALTEERLRISADLHDEIGSTLSSISIYNELAQKFHQSQPDKSQELLTKTSFHIQKLMNHIEKTILSLKDDKTLFFDVKAELDKYCQELLSVRYIEYSLEIDHDVEAFLKDPRLMKNLLLICKEAIHNVSKYSNASTVVISLKVIDRFLKIIISDDGIGFDIKNYKAGNGLTNMNKRCIDLQGEFHINTANGMGTSIICKVPISS